MKHPITDDEREHGLVTISALPSQAEAIANLLETNTGMTLAPPVRFSNDDGSESEDVRILTFKDGPPPLTTEETP